MEGGTLVTLHIYDDLVQRTEEWFAVRRGIVTASVVGQLITTQRPSALDYTCLKCQRNPGNACVSTALGKPRIPLQKPHGERSALASEQPPRLAVADTETSRGLTLALAAERITDHTDSTYVSYDMARGIEDEPRAVSVYSEHFAPVETTGFMVRDFEPGFSIGYSPDGLVGDDGLIEVKSRQQRRHLGTILDGEIPAENMAQIQCGLLVSDRSWCDYVSYCGGMRLWRRRVEPDPLWHEVILAAVAQFETAAAAMVAAYLEATDGMPDTKRAPEMELVI